MTSNVNTAAGFEQARVSALSPADERGRLNPCSVVVIALASERDRGRAVARQPGCGDPRNTRDSGQAETAVKQAAAVIAREGKQS